MKRFLLIAGAGALMLVGILIGAIYGSTRTATASAKEVTSSTSSATNNYCTQFQQGLAKRLNVSGDALQKAEAASAQDVLAQMVKDGKITQAQANQIKSHINSTTNCQFQDKSGSSQFDQGKMQKYLTSAEAQVAKGLGISTSALTSQLQSGKSLHDIATAHHVSDAQLRTLLTNTIQSTLKQAVSAGDITQSEADSLYQRVISNPQMLDRLINGHMGSGQGSWSSI